MFNSQAASAKKEESLDLQVSDRHLRMLDEIAHSSCKSQYLEHPEGEWLMLYKLPVFMCEPRH